MTVPGWCVPLAVTAPNVILLLLPARGARTPLSPPRWRRRLGSVETITRAIVLVAPLFLSCQVFDPLTWGGLCVSALSLTVYYGLWIRFLVSGRDRMRLYASLGPFPVPMALAPAVYLLASAIISGSQMYTGTVVAFAGAHVLGALVDARRLSVAATVAAGAGGG